MNELLPKFIQAAKAVIYDAKRAAPLLAMLATKSGAVNAVHTVSAVIERKKPIPPEMKNDFGVAILMLLIDVAQQVTGEKVKPELVKQVIAALQAETAQPTQAGLPAPAQPTQPQPQGLINQGA